MRAKPFLITAALGLLLATCGVVHAQLRLPSLPSLPALPSIPAVPLDRVSANRPTDTVLAPSDLRGLRLRTVRGLLRRHADVLEADPAGEPALRAEVLAFSPSASALEALRLAGYKVLREQTLDGLDERIVVLQAPASLTTAAAVARARELDPQGSYDFNHIYTASGTVTPAASATPTNSAPDATAEHHRVGLIDGGVDLTHPALKSSSVQLHGCASPVPSAHGTAVASLLVGRSEAFSGAAPGAALFAADVYCGQAVGGAVDAVTDSLAWLAREHVPVINISLVGPANRLLERVIHQLVTRGHVVVAAVGNDGPAAPPLYPAAYADVIGVTGVDARERVLPEAARGPQVMFAAPGAEMAVAAYPGTGFDVARGTSFAAPLVAGLLARQIEGISATASQKAVNALAASAQDLGAPGRDPVFGVGLVGESLRANPALAKK